MNEVGGSLSPSTGVTVISGYVKQIGKLVVANLRVNLTTTSEVTISGFPAPLASGYNYIPVMVNHPEFLTAGFMSAGTLHLGMNQQISGLLVHVCYIAS